MANHRLNQGIEPKPGGTPSARSAPAEVFAYGLADFCLRMGIGRTLAYRCIKENLLHSVKVAGKRRLIPATECTAFLARLAEKGGAK